MGSERGELTRALTRRAVEAKNGNETPVNELVERATDVALARTLDERTWALTRMAAVLRRGKQFDQALKLLDAAAELRPSDWPERALYTCAIAVHCDRGNARLALRLGEQQLGRSVDIKLFNALARVYHVLFLETEDELYEKQWKAMSRRIEEWEATPAGEGAVVVTAG